MENKKNNKLYIIIGMLIILIAIATTYIVYDKVINKPQPKEEPQINNNDSNTKKEEDNSSIIGYYSVIKDIDEGEDSTSYKYMAVAILNDSEMTIGAGNGQAQYEGTKGIYTINDNILTYTRKYYGDNVSGWEVCHTIDEKSYSEDLTSCGAERLTKTQDFIIDKDKKTMTLKNKQVKDTDYYEWGNIVLSKAIEYYKTGQIYSSPTNVCDAEKNPLHGHTREIILKVDGTFEIGYANDCGGGYSDLGTYEKNNWKLILKRVAPELFDHLSENEYKFDENGNIVDEDKNVYQKVEFDKIQLFK